MSTTDKTSLEARKEYKRPSVGLTFDGLFVTGFTSDSLATLSDSANDAAPFEVAEAERLAKSNDRYAIVILPLYWVREL